MVRRFFIYSKHSIAYYFTASKKISSPLLFVFHGAGSNYSKAPKKFRDERLNVVASIDEFGYEFKGS